MFKLVGFVTAAVMSFAPVFAAAQGTPGAALRPVQGQTIISSELPAAQFTFGKEFRYVGSQRLNLYGTADAEQHLFARSAKNGTVERFYWVQFEHFYATNTYTYDYPADHTTRFADLKFVYDVKSFPDYAAGQREDPKSDGAAIARLLAEHNLAFPRRAARVRMFHLPTPDRRSEVMIIYGEALPDNSAVPVRLGGVDLEK